MKNKLKLKFFLIDLHVDSTIFQGQSFKGTGESDSWSSLIVPLLGMGGEQCGDTKVGYFTFCKRLWTFFYMQVSTRLLTVH